jgi:hypothetical protein
VRALASGPAAIVRAAAVALAEIHRRSLIRYGSGIALERAFSTQAHDSGLPGRMQRALTGADLTEKRAIGLLLGFFSSDECLWTLVPLFQEAPPVAEAAAASFGRLARAGSLQAIGVLESSNSAERALLLPQLAGVRAALPAVVQCLSDPDAQVRVLACDALAKTGESSCVGALFGLLDDPDLAVSQAAVAALQSLGSEETEQGALARAATGPVPRRRAALRIWRTSGYPSALDLLISAVGTKTSGCGKSRLLDCRARARPRRSGSYLP